MATGLSQNEELMECFCTAVTSAKQRYQEQKSTQQHQQQQQQSSLQQQQQPQPANQMSDADKQHLKTLLDSAGMARFLQSLVGEGLTIADLRGMTDGDPPGSSRIAPTALVSERGSYRG